VTHAGVGSLVVATRTNRNVTNSGDSQKKRTAKSSTMKGASSPCQSAAAETEPNRERLHRKDRSPLLYSRDRNQCVVAHWKLCRNGSFGHTCQFGRKASYQRDCCSEDSD